MEGSTANLSERVYLSSFDITTRASIGDKIEDREAVTQTLKELMELHSGFTIVDLYLSIKFLPLITGIKGMIERIFWRMDAIFNSIMEQHRAANAARNGGGGVSEDLTDVLLKYQEDGAEMPLTTDNIKAVLMDIFLVGGETSATAVDWAMSEMIENPSTLKKAQDEVRNVFDVTGHVDESNFEELKYIKLVIKEALRLHPHLPLLVPRERSQSCEINGHKIPSRTRVIINAWALGRDAKCWKDANEFIPERFEDGRIDYKGNNFEFIPFGGGRTTCPGMSFGLVNVEYALATLLYHFDWAMPDGTKNEELDMAEGLGFSAKRKQDLLLVPTVKRPLKMVS